MEMVAFPQLAQPTFTDVARLPQLTAQDRPKKRHQVAKACQHCAVSHLSCSEQRPCDRCTKKGLDCEERPRKKRNLGNGRSERRGEEDELDDDELELEEPVPRPRGRKPKRKADYNVDDEYIPEDMDLHHSHNHSHSHAHAHLQHTISPTSASPRTHNQSESSEENKDASGSDLESLVVAALAEEGPHNIKVDPAMLMAQASMMSMMQQPGVMPMMNLAGMMPMLQQQHQQQYGYQMPFMPGMSNMMPGMEQFNMMQFGILPIQWRFQGQPMAQPLPVPMTCTVRELFGHVFNRLAIERQILASERLALGIVVNNQRFSLDENAHAAMPVSVVGFADPSAILEVIKYTPQ